MNHHADKIVYGVGSQGEDSNPGSEAVLEEFHGCPACGSSGSRIAPAVC